MSSPNEPGHPRAGDGSGGANGSTSGSAGPSSQDTGSPGGGPQRSSAQQSGGSAPAHVTDNADVPPWQRGPAGRPRPAQASESEGRRDGGASGLDARLNRFISGGSTPQAEQPVRAERTESARTEGPRPEAPRTEGARTEVRRPEAAPRGESGAFASELPDLSGPKPPPPPQRKPADRSEQPKAPPAKAVQVATRQHSGPVRASMQIRRIDPWSMLKVSLLLSVALFFVWMIAVAFLYLVLGGMGVWSKLNSNVGDLLTSASGSSGGELVSSGTIFGGAALIGLVNIVLLTAAATVGAFIYNLTTDLVGGVEVTLADRD